MTVKLTQGMLLTRMINRIRQSLELQEILSATVAETQAFLGSDRVKVYRFHPDGSGQVIAEAVNQERLPSLLDFHFPAGDIPPAARELFIKARQRVIVDVPQQLSTISRLQPAAARALSLEDKLNLPVEEVLQRPVDPCHIEYLTSMGVQSSVVVPILDRDALWGLLVAHHASPKTLPEEQLQILQMLSDQVSIAVSQSHLLLHAREQFHRETVINQISTLLHSPLNSEEILQVVLEQLVRSLQALGGRLYLTPTDLHPQGELYTFGEQPIFNRSSPHSQLESYAFWQKLLLPTSETKGNLQHGANQIHASFSNSLEDSLLSTSLVNNTYLPEFRAINDIDAEPELATVLSYLKKAGIRSLMAMSLQYSEQCIGCLTVFRSAIDTDKVWAGKFNPDTRLLRVQNSFAAWREIRRNQPQAWSDSEIILLRSLSTHLTMAVMQNRIYQWEREQRLLVEMRNQELNTARTVAEEANQLKSDFLSSTSHELRTPLTSILNYLKLLKEGFYDNEEELKDYINIAFSAAENLVYIINDVLDIAKIEAGRMNLIPEPVSLKEMLEEQLNLFKLEMRQRSIPLIVECEVEYIYADRVKLRQILTNLISNAFKFTSQGEVRLRVVQHKTSTASWVEISVKDTGIGIEPGKQELLFEPFVQADGSIKRRYGGTGLGLTICKRLVAIMGGKIWLDSAGKGEGTTVTFTLPLPETL